MDEHTTDLEPARERTDDERRATAGLLDVAGGGRRDGARGSGSGLLAGVQRRAVRQHRRRLAGAAVAGVAALGVGALVVPAVVPGGGSGIVAALGLEDRGGAPAPETAPAPPPAPAGGLTSTFDGAGDSMMLTDAQVEEFVAGVQGRAPGVLGNANASGLPDDGPSLTVGGWCRDADLPVRLVATEGEVEDPGGVDPAPRGRWSGTWQAGVPARGGVDITEDVVKWAYDRSYLSDVAAADSYVDGTRASPVRCGSRAGQDLAAGFRVLTPPLPGVVQAVALVGGAPDTWEVRTVGAAEGSGAAVDLTVVLPASSAQEAALEVVPLMRQALDRVTAREAVERAASEAGTEAGAPRSSTSPQRVVVRPYGWSKVQSSLTRDQVATTLPGTLSDLQPQWDFGPPGEVCVGPFGAPTAYSDGDGRSESASGFEVSRDGAATTVAEWVVSWIPSEVGPGSRLLGLDTPCGPAPEGETWEPVTLSHDGADVPAVVRHPDGDPDRWVVRVTDAAEPAVAVGLEIETTASSQADLAAVVVPLLDAAQQQAYAANFVPSTP